MKCVVKIQSNRRAKGKRKPECRYYICSRIASAADLMAAARSHWGVENNVHWVLDVTFDEDGSRVRKGNAQQNLATMRRIALNSEKRSDARYNHALPISHAKHWLSKGEFYENDSF